MLLLMPQQLMMELLLVQRRDGGVPKAWPVAGAGRVATPARRCCVVEGRRGGLRGKLRGGRGGCDGREEW